MKLYSFIIIELIKFIKIEEKKQKKGAIIRAKKRTANRERSSKTTKNASRCVCTMILKLMGI